MDLHLPPLLLLLLLHPLIFLTLLFALAARNNSIDQYVSPSGATRGNNAILGTVSLIRYYHTIFFLYVLLDKERVNRMETGIKLIKAVRF